MPPKLSLLVLRCTDIDATAAFYEKLDFRFAEEHHGTGPRHLASPEDGWLLELYPLAQGDLTPTLPPRLGLRVDDLPRILAEVGQGTIGEDGHALVVDPDGRKIDLVAHEIAPLVTAWLVLSTAEAIDLSFVGPQLAMPTQGVEVAGQPRPKNRPGGVGNVSVWYGETVGRRTHDVHDVVSEVLDGVDAVREAHLTLLRDHELIATICVSIRTDDATAVGTFDRLLLSRLVDLRIELDLNFYVEG